MTPRPIPAAVPAPAHPASMAAIEQRMLEHVIASGRRELEQHARHLRDKADEVDRHVRRFDAAETSAAKADELRFALGTLTGNAMRRVDVLAHVIGEIGGCLARVELRAELGAQLDRALTAADGQS